jgi:hypothetical protein
MEWAMENTVSATHKAARTGQPKKAKSPQLRGLQGIFC